MTPIQKPWGSVLPLLEDPRLVLHRLEVQSGFSSLHAHSWQWNRFYVRSGRIRVSVSTRGGWAYSELGPGSTIDIPPRTLHRFVVLQPGVVWEVYWPERISSRDPLDIVRVDEGGVCPRGVNRLDGSLLPEYPSSSRERESTPAATGCGPLNASPHSCATAGC